MTNNIDYQRGQDGVFQSALNRISFQCTRHNALERAQKMYPDIGLAKQMRVANDLMSFFETGEVPDGLIALESVKESALKHALVLNCTEGHRKPEDIVATAKVFEDYLKV